MAYNFTPEQICLQNLSKSVWQRRGQAKHIGLAYGEETITETLLLDIAQNYPGNATIVPFTKHIEGKLGADWAWSFESADGKFSFPMMIQAKLLDTDDKNYAQLLHTVGKSRIRQIDKLIQNAKNFQIPAFYAFYNHLSDRSRIPSNCKSLGTSKPTPMPEAWGISIASANNVLAILNDISFDEHCQNSKPLHCLLCSQGGGIRDLFGSPGQISENFLPEVDGVSLKTLTKDSELPPGVHKGQIPLFEIASEYENADEKTRFNLITYFKEKYPNVDGIVVVRDGK